MLNIERKLNKIIKNNRWTNLICVDETDKYVGYCKSLQRLQKELKIHKGPYASSVYNEELALQIIRECISINMQQIAIWLREPDRILSLLFIRETPLGIVLKQGNTDTESVFTASIILKKSDKPNKNRSGFYVSHITPVPEMIAR